MRQPDVSFAGAAASYLRFAVITAVLAFTTYPAVAQEQPIPAELQFLNKLGKPYRITYEPWTEMQIPTGNYGSGGIGKMARGKHWQFPVIVTGAMTPEAVWAIAKPAFLANGWTIVHEWSAGGLVLFVHYQKDGVEAWAEAYPSPERVVVEVVEIAPIPFTFTLKPPAATPEPVNATAGNFPWLGPLPGWQFRSSVADPDPFRVALTGVTEPELVAPSSIIKTYRQPPEGMSSSLFHAAYHDALIKAGWTILYDRQDVSFTAHFSQNGRNIWATLYHGEFNEIRVADAGAANKDMISDLKTNCHIAIYGVLFDFNKSTLQAASDPVLQQVLDLLKKNPTQKIEVQGHTDNVGGDAYNQTLSEARVKAIVTWLNQHGIAADRLTAKGFGRTRPIADNGTDVGRAKNRRVEIADPDCAAKPK